MSDFVLSFKTGPAALSAFAEACVLFAPEAKRPVMFLHDVRDGRATYTPQSLRKAIRMQRVVNDAPLDFDEFSALTFTTNGQSTVALRRVAGGRFAVEVSGVPPLSKMWWLGPRHAADVKKALARQDFVSWATAEYHDTPGRAAITRAAAATAAATAASLAALAASQSAAAVAAV